MAHRREHRIDEQWWKELSPEVVPHSVTNWQLIETHISIICLTGEWAYKFKKPVSFGFLDYSTLERRKHFCQRELEINGRFSEALYDSVWALCENRDGRLRLVENESSVCDGERVVEYAVRMRQFPADVLLSCQLKSGLEIKRMDDLAQSLAAMHGRLPTSSFSPDEFANVTRKWALKILNICKCTLRTLVRFRSWRLGLTNN
ncbi:MAG: hypothetical protein R3C03_16900 [Pirellulaceae bacterium]